MTIANAGGARSQAVVTTVAAPTEPLPAGGDGFAIERTYYTLDGSEANVTEAAQNERYVVVLKVTEQQFDWPSRVLVSDLLPAGFEIDNPGLVSSANLSNFGLARPDARRRISNSATTVSSRPSTATAIPAGNSRWPMSCAP
jgi:uncharacterized protein YfaS (alpha-2-macroglobulin family)